MQITSSAQHKLREFERRFRHGERGFHFGKLGGCHGAVPRMRPGRDPRHGERSFDVDGMTLFVRPREFTELEPYILDYRKGLLLSRFTLEADCDACVACFG